MIKIKDRVFKRADLEFLDSVNYPEYKEFVFFTETLFKSSDGTYILETQYERSPLWFADEIREGKLTDKDLELNYEYTIITKEEADSFLESSVWKV